GVDADRTKFFPNTAPEIFKPIDRDQATRPDFLPKAGFNLMFAGNIGDGQGLESIVETADLLKDEIDINWIFVGSGRALDSFKSKVESRGLSSRFIFAGRHPENSMPEFFAHADA